MNNKCNPVLLTSYSYLEGGRDLGFALPLLRRRGETDWFVQRVDFGSDKVTGFQKIEIDPSGVRPLGTSIVVPLASEQIFVFECNSQIHAGTRTELAPLLRVCMEQNPAEIAVALQIAQLIGSPSERRYARARMARHIQQELGNRYAGEFYKNALSGAFWLRLYSAGFASDPRLRELRSLLRVSLRADGILVVYGVDCCTEEEQRAVEHIASDLKAEFEHHGLQFDLPRTPADHARRLRRIQKAARQEERIAMLLAEVLRDHRTGSELLRKFGTRAAYERIAVTLVMQALGHPSDPNARPYNDEMIVAKLVNRLYTACFPLSRGYLLENLSKHLAIYPEINKAIARKLEETGSIFVHRHASAIRSYLIAKSDGNSLPEMQSNALPSLFGADR